MTAAWNSTAAAAVKAWVVAATGLPAAKVIRAKQRGPRPAPPFVTFSVTTSPIGQDWVDVEDDADDEDVVHYVARGHRSATITFTAMTAGQPDGASATELLEQIGAAVVLPSILEALDTAGVGIGVIGPVQEFDEVVAELIEAGARLVVTAFLASELSEVGNFIETVDIEGEIE